MDFSEINWDVNTAGNWPVSIKISAGIFVFLVIISAWFYQFTYDQQLELERSDSRARKSH